MSENAKFNERCIKGNAIYYKIQIDGMIDYEINELGVNESLYKKFGENISNSFSKFSKKMLHGTDIQQSITDLRDEAISQSAKIEEIGKEQSSPSMRPFFKLYIFDKIYSMGLNIKKGIIPDDCDKVLEEENSRLEEENRKFKEENAQKSGEDKVENEIKVTIEDETEERKPDLIDNMFDFFFNGGKSSSSGIKKDPEKESKNKSNNDKSDIVKEDNTKNKIKV